MPLFRKSLLALLLSAIPIYADGPADNQPDNVRPMPPKGVVVPPDDRYGCLAPATPGGVFQAHEQPVSHAK